MLKTFEELAKNVSLKPKALSIDNVVFKLHYRVTFLILLTGTILVSSQQYIGEHIRCITDGAIPINVIETYCFFTSTFTVVRHIKSDLGDASHLGVGPMVDEDDPVIYHAYYQWVPFVLFGQALCFYLPHFLWRKFEGGRIKALVAGLEHAALASGEQELTINDKMKVPSKKDRSSKIEDIQKAFIDRLHINRPWASWLVFCEVLNAVNVVAQMFLTDIFLGGNFLDLGPAMVQDTEVDPLDVIFPKMTKCSFHKYGPSGSIQKHDALCVMALNVINEKIYVFLWFWLVILAVATALGILWRVLTFFLHSRSNAFNNYLFKNTCPGPIDPYDLVTITGQCYFSDWLFLYYLGKNMDGFVFRDLFVGLAYKMDDMDWDDKLAKVAADQASQSLMSNMAEDQTYQQTPHHSDIKNKYDL